MKFSLSSILKIVCLGICLFSGLALSAQVQGTALLTGQSNHSGITVIFTATSTSGQTDTTFTQSNGDYSINLTPGVYEIRMQAANYQTVFYNQNQPLLLVGNETLLPVTLAPGSVKYVSGTVSGTWDRDTIYIANGDLTVPTGNSLTIEDGTQIYFEPGFKMTIDGQMIAVGTDTSPILFSLQSINPGTESWEGLFFENLNLYSEMTYCVVEYAENSVHLEEILLATVDPTVVAFRMSNSIVRHCTFGVILNVERRVEITNSEFYDFQWYGVGFFGSNTSYNEPGPYFITCNKVHDGNYSGFYSFQSEANAYIAGNEFYDLANAYGILSGRQDGALTIENNVFRDNAHGLRTASYDDADPALIRNNLFLRNSIAMSYVNIGGDIVQMNAMVDNTYGVITYGTTVLGDFSYNLVSQNDTNYTFQTPLPFVGIPITVNANGDSTDAYFNLEADPLLGSDFFPTFGSPLYDAGNPAYTDVDGTTRDIGLSPDSLSCWPPAALARMVYPGDANFNQVANVWDLLAIGVKYGQTGPIRPGADLSWTGQNAPEWGDTLASGLDIKHVDCNGDGLINADDTLAIVQNYALTHTALKTSASGDVPLYMLMPTTQNPGDTLTIPIMLGNMDTVANDMYGMAFAMNYDSSLVVPNSVEMRFDVSWLGTDNVDMLSLYYDDFTASKFEAAMVRTDGVEVSGFGQIATVIVVLDDDIAKREIPFSLSWEVADLIHADESPILVNTQDGQSTIETDTASTDPTTSVDPSLANSLELFPNPANEQLSLRINANHPHFAVSLLDMTGRVQLESDLTARQTQLALDVSQLPAGIYVLRLRSAERGIISRKVIIE
ncbi:MAG: T9SS type A sorting domain-containing protein [Bacteroidota bacterium]